MGQGTRGAIGKEDFSFHDPAAGTAAQTFNRTTSTGGTTPITKGSALDWPLRDAVVVSGARSPFEALADTQAAKNVETALADVRKNITHYKNFEYYGGTAGDVSAGTAAKNTEVLNKIKVDYAAELREGGGIFFPGYTYEFAEVAGAMPTFDTFPNVTLVGTGFGTTLKRDTSASTALSLMNFIDSSGVRLVDLTFDRNGTTGVGSCVKFTSVAEQAIGNLYVLGVAFSGGATQLSCPAIGPAAYANVWIKDSRFFGASGANVAINSVTGLHIVSNDFSTGGTGISLTSDSNSAPLSEIEIVGNTMTATSQGIAIARAGTYSASAHRRISIGRNKISASNISVQGVNLVELTGNTLYAGQIALLFDMTTASNLKLIDNDVTGATGSGVQVVGTGCTLTGYQIRGGTISNCTQRGIYLAFATAPIRAGTIQGVSVINCSREDSAATDYSAICLDAPNAGGGVQDSIISGNVLRCYSATTVNANLHKYGVEEVAGGASDRNMIGPNFVKGYVSATESLISGAASLDVVVAVTAAVATYARFDGGAAV